MVDKSLIVLFNKYWRLNGRETDVYQLKPEKLDKDLWEELYPILQEHWDELGMASGPKELLVDKFMYQQANKQEDHVVLIARRIVRGKPREIIGYVSAFIAQHQHHIHTRFAQVDCLFIRKQFRRGLLGYKFIRDIEAAIKTHDHCVTYLQLFTNSNLDLSPIMGRLGYVPSDIVYTKEI
tara:strand:+ start:185 stop:724 length:540 start_codon:yes stop_codon:yes gene_type:complete